jgi:hypothetical protein
MANKHKEAPHFIKGGVMRIESVYTQLRLNVFSQATLTPLQISKIEDGIA